MGWAVVGMCHKHKNAGPQNYSAERSRPPPEHPAHQGPGLPALRDGGAGPLRVHLPALPPRPQLLVCCNPAFQVGLPMGAMVGETPTQRNDLLSQNFEGNAAETLENHVASSSHPWL